MPVKAEVPDGEIGAKGSGPAGKGGSREFQVRLVCVPTGPRGGHVHLGPVRGDVVRPADADVKDVGIVLKNIPCPVGVVGIGVQDGEATDAGGVPETGDGDGHVVEAAVAAEKAPAGVMSTGADEGEGPFDLA